MKISEIERDLFKSRMEKSNLFSFSLSLSLSFRMSITARCCVKLICRIEIELNPAVKWKKKIGLSGKLLATSVYEESWFLFINNAIIIIFLIDFFDEFFSVRLKIERFVWPFQFNRVCCYGDVRIHHCLLLLLFLLLCFILPVFFLLYFFVLQFFTTDSYTLIAWEKFSISLALFFFFFFSNSPNIFSSLRFFSFCLLLAFYFVWFLLHTFSPGK